MHPWYKTQTPVHPPHCSDGLRFGGACKGLPSAPPREVLGHPCPTHRRRTPAASGIPGDPDFSLPAAAQKSNCQPIADPWRPGCLLHDDPPTSQSDSETGPLTHCSLFAKMEGVYERMQIEWGTRAIRDMRRLAARDRERIIAKIEQYAEKPRIPCPAGDRTGWQPLQAVESRPPPRHLHHSIWGALNPHSPESSTQEGGL